MNYRRSKIACRTAILKLIREACVLRLSSIVIASWLKRRGAVVSHRLWSRQVNLTFRQLCSSNVVERWDKLIYCVDC
jgi:hypothetical protein